MNRRYVMSNNNVNIATSYYTAMSERNFENLAQYLHPEVKFVGPLSQTAGKDNVLQSVKGFAGFFKTLVIRNVFGSDKQAILVYDVEFPAPIGALPAVSIMDIDNGLITSIELFFDASAFRQV